MARSQKKLTAQQIMIAAFAVQSVGVSAASLTVSGWGALGNFPSGDKPPIWLGDDPIAGRLSCPPLTRLEGNPLVNMPVLLKDPPTVETNATGEKWTYTLRSGLKWWSGSAIDGVALSTWLKDHLSTLSQEKLGHALDTNYTVTAVAPLSATIQWNGKSPFGPYIFSGVSLSRPAKSGYECAGLYSLAPSGKGLELTLNVGYKTKFSKIYIQDLDDTRPQADASIRFKMASDMVKASSTAMHIQTCAAKLDIPLVTAVVWNPATPTAETPSLRQALTMITPRGDLLRTGAGELGSLVSAPILRLHPGYDPKNLVRPYNLQAGGQVLEQNGFKQAHIGLPRARTADKPTVLRIGRISGKQPLIEKVFGDSYASSGIEIQFEDAAIASPGLDGVLISAFLPWTSMDFRALLKGPFPFAPVSDKQLSDLADSYARSLTEQAPDTGILRKIHGRWMEVEPWTMLMSHQYCATAEGLKIPGRINVMDPDWFRHLAID